MSETKAKPRYSGIYVRHIEEGEEIPFPLYPETGRGSPNRGGISDLPVEFSFVRRQPATRLTMTILRGGHRRERPIGNPSVLLRAIGLSPLINPLHSRTPDNIEPCYDRLIADRPSRIRVTRKIDSSPPRHALSGCFHAISRLPGSPASTVRKPLYHLHTRENGDVTRWFHKISTKNCH